MPTQLSVEQPLGRTRGSDASITMAVTGSKTGPGANGRRPCLVNGGWGPPFTWDPVIAPPTPASAGPPSLLRMHVYTQLMPPMS